jgi:hypothetical protein
MLRLILLPFVLVAVVLGSIGWLGWSHFFSDHIHPRWDPNLVYSGQVEMQRHLAKCYEVGCPEALRSIVLACAWREIIVEEMKRASMEDIEEAKRVCTRLSPTERSTLDQVETNIRARMQKTTSARSS